MIKIRHRQAEGGPIPDLLLRNRFSQMRDRLWFVTYCAAIVLLGSSLQGQDTGAISSVDVSTHARVEEQSPETSKPAAQPAPGFSRWSFHSAQSTFWPSRPSTPGSMTDWAKPNEQGTRLDSLTGLKAGQHLRLDQMIIVPLRPPQSQGEIPSASDLGQKSDDSFLSTTPPASPSAPRAKPKQRPKLADGVSRPMATDLSAHRDR